MFRKIPVNDLNLLGLGSKFCPRPVEPNLSVYQDALSSVIRRFRIIDYFANIATDVEDSDFDPRFKTVSTWEPPENTGICNRICRYISNVGTAILSRSVYQRQSCISRKLKAFLQNKHVKIVPADKNLGLCIFTITDYDKIRLKFIFLITFTIYALALFRAVIGTESQLSGFQITCPAVPTLLCFVSKLCSAFTLSLWFKTEMSIFHVLPKLHKNSSTITSRPIVGAVQWITTRWSIYLCSIWKKSFAPSPFPILSLISKVEHLILFEDEFLVTADVSSLYTMMSLARLYDCLRTKGIAEFDISVANFICSSNYFRYGSTVFKQLDGIAMGCNAAVHFANLYLDDFDNHFAPFCKFYCRYIDDIFFIWKGPEHLLHSLFHQMNAYIPNIHLTFSFSQKSVNFLDLSIFSSNNQLMFRTFQKSFNIYQYLPPFYLHSPSCISGFIKGELIRFVRSNTLLADRLIFANLFRKRLLARGYSSSYLAKIFSSHFFFDTPPCCPLFYEKIIPLIIPFYRSLITLNCRKLIRFLNEHFLQARPGYNFCLRSREIPIFFSYVRVQIFRSNKNNFSKSAQSQASQLTQEYKNHCKA